MKEEMVLVNIPTDQKRFHFRFNRHIQLWVCEDRKWEVCGLGPTWRDAADDAQRELEMLTSDIHQ